MRQLRYRTFWDGGVPEKAISYRHHIIATAEAMALGCMHAK